MEDEDRANDQSPAPSLQKKKKKKSCSEWCRGWIGSSTFYIYINFFMSQWGDWMWQFAVGLYLVHLDGGQLRLAAIFGLSGGGCVLLFGGIIGDWVDRNQRLKVVRISLFIQNLSVTLSAVSVCAVLKFEEFLPLTATNRSDNITDTTILASSLPSRYRTSTDLAGHIILEIAIIVLAIAGQLASVAYKIAIEKDWLVVIAAGKSSRLANLNATTRSLDLMCKLVAPITVGLIMTYGSLFISALCIAVWNVFSMFLEYAILSHVYHLVPQLATKKSSTEIKEEEMKELGGDSEEIRPMNSLKIFSSEQDQHFSHDEDAEKSNHAAELDQIVVRTISSENKAKEAANGEESKKKGEAATGEAKDSPTCCEKVFEPILVIGRGWRTYARQKVVFAGMSLSFLYMTVLGFDSITVGYIYANDICEWLVGLSMALAGFTGIGGTVLFARLQRKCGLNRTGLIAFALEIICLTLAVAAVWTPGSRFDPYYAYREPSASSALSTNNNLTCCHSVTRTSPGIDDKVVNNDRGNMSITDNVARDGDPCGADVFNNATMCGSRSVTEKKAVLNVSIILLLTGIIASRVGLWMADLVVTQLMQESIVESERGIVNGVQNSLNMFMDMLKFILVIFVPEIEYFGFHIIISFTFICVASLLFVYHTRRAVNSAQPQTSPQI